MNLDRLRKLKGMPAREATPPPAPKQPAPKKKKNFVTALQRDNQQAKKERLPDGSTVAATYHAETQTWKATLTVTLKGESGQFEGEAGGLFTLLHKLDDQYRVWLKSRQAKA
jgi:hypothetical protein